MGFSQIDRYILRQLLMALAAVTAALVALIWLTQSLRFVELVVDRGLSLRVFFQLTGLLLPNFLAVVLPITSFVVVLATYQRLATDREITVMRGAGLSPLALARPALAMALLAALLGYALSLYLVPVSAAAFRDYQFAIRNKVAAFLLQEGVFTPLSDKLTVYVRDRDANGTLHGIIVQDERDTHTRATILAQRGQLLTRNDTPQVALVNGTRQELDLNTGRLSVLTFAADTIDLSAGSKSSDMRFRDVGEMAMGELLAPGDAVPANLRGKYLVEAHRRLSQPLTAFGYTALALVAALTGTFRRAGNIWRPLAASGGLILLIALGFAANSLATRNPGLWPLMWLVAILPAPAALGALLQPMLADGPRAADAPRPA